MRQITNDNQRTSGSNRYPTEGITEFYLKGYVQAITQNHKYHCDYIRFSIVNDGNEYYDAISATLPHKMKIAVDVGDHIECWGTIKSWTRDGKITLELIIDQIREVNDGMEELTNG